MKRVQVLIWALLALVQHIFLNPEVQAQVLPPRSVSPLLRKLIETKKGIPQLESVDLSAIALPVEAHFKDNQKYLVRTREGLYVGVEGTGILYKALLDGDSLRYERMDRTKYGGATFCAANFSFRNKIYSFGGYGFWRTNGALRVYDTLTREWDIVPLASEHPNLYCEGPSGSSWSADKDLRKKNGEQNTRFAPSFFWLDSAAGKFYSFTQRDVDEIIKKDIASEKYFSPTVSVLDLATGQWTNIGELKRYGWNKRIALPWGMLIDESSSSFYLADVKNNRIRKPSVRLQQALKKLYSDVSGDLFYCLDSTIYFGRVGLPIWDSIPVFSKDFIDTGIPLYTPSIVQTSSHRWLFLPPILMVMILLVIWIWRKKTNTKRTVVPTTDMPPSADSPDIFNEVEKGLVLLLWTASREHSFCSTEDLNKVLGVSAKNEAIKRKVRSDTIQSINSKWMVLAQSDEKLIESRRSLEDKRSREYYIQETLMKDPRLQRLTMHLS